MKRFTLALASLAVGVAGLFPVAASAASPAPVVGTYSVADNGQGEWGGGALYADGSVGGLVAFAAGTGSQQIIAHFLPFSWQFVPLGTNAQGAVDICYSVQAIKGPATAIFGSQFCLSDFGGTLPVTGTAVKVTVDGFSTVMRVTLTR